MMIHAGKALFLLLAVVGLFHGSAGIIRADEVVIDARSNIFGAHRPVGSQTPQPGGGGGGMPAPFIGLSGTDTVITFSGFTGLVSCCSGSLANGPDGGNSFSTNINGFDGISGIRFDGRQMFLVGVFTNGDPSGLTAPASLDFTGNSTFTSLSPLLRQVFFIGDGLTGTGTGNSQQFMIPFGATRLYLGFADAANFQGNPGLYDDNVNVTPGGFRSDFTVTGGAAAVPEPTTLLLFGTGLAGIATRVCKRRKARDWESST